MVPAPDGSCAGLVWGPDEEHMKEYIAPEEGRWGVYAIQFPRPTKTVEDIVFNFRPILPDLQRKHAQIKAAERLRKPFDAVESREESRLDLLLAETQAHSLPEEERPFVIEDGTETHGVKPPKIA